MTERAAVFETTGIGVETTVAPGTAVQATKILAAMSATVTPMPEVKEFTPKGYKIPTVAVLIKEQTNIKFSGIGTYNEIIYPLASVLSNPTITTPGGATLTRQWDFTMNSNAPDTQRTYSLEFGTNSIRSWHAPYGLFTEFGMMFNRKDVVKVDAAAFGQAGYDDKVRWLATSGPPTAGTFTITVGASTTSALAYNATASTIQTALAALASVGSGNVTCTGGPINTTPVRILFTGTLALTTNPTLPTPISTTDTLTGGASSITRLSPGTSQLSLVPISPTTIDVKIATTQAGLTGATPLTRDFSFHWKLAGRDNPVFALASQFGAGYAATVEATPKGEVVMDVAGDDAGMGLLANLRNNDLLFARVSSTGPVTETGFNYSLQVDVCFRLTKISDFKDVDGGLLGAQFTGVWQHDPTWGKSTQITLRNLQTAL